MSFEEMATWLYGVSGVSSCMMYIPQVLKLIREPESRRAMSLVSWVGWLLGSTCALVYAIGVMGSYAMAGVTGANAFFQAIVTVMVAMQRMKDRKSTANGIPMTSPAV